MNNKGKDSDKNKAVVGLRDRIMSIVDLRCRFAEKMARSDDAYASTTYGCRLTTETIIRHHQGEITRQINAKVASRTEFGLFIDYAVMYSFQPNLRPYVDEILRPFKDNGYRVTSVRDFVNGCEDTYIIDWYHESIV